MPLQVPVGEALLGRVLDGLGRPVDGGPPLDRSLEWVDLASETPHALARTRVEERSEEHTSELQSRQYLVCRLLLEKKKNQHHNPHPPPPPRPLPSHRRNRQSPY